MKRYTIGLILLLIVGCGKKDGVHTTYFDDENCGEDSQFEKKWKKEEITYKDGKKNGLNISWLNYGGNFYTKNSEGNYKDDKKVGVWTVYHQYTKEIRSKYDNYKERVKRGYESGIDDAGCEGEYVTGNKNTEYRYKDGILNGLSTSWYKTGGKKSEGNYKDDKKIGVWREGESKVEYFENGRSISYKLPSSFSVSLTICDCDGNYGSLTTSQKRECDKMTDGLSTSEIQTLLLLEQCD